MSKRSRRQFLEDAMFAAAAAATAGTAGPLRAAESSTSTSPNERLSVVVVGVRGRGGDHLNAFAGRPDTEVTYVCDIDEKIGHSRAEQVGNRQGRAPSFVRDLREALEDDSVDIVSIATPNHWHALGAIWAIQASKHVYLEKPVSHNVSEGRRIVEAARKYDKICQTGTQCRSNPGIRDAMDFMHSGGIGQVKVARGLCYKRRTSIGPKGIYEVPSHIDYNLWLGPAPEAPLTRPQFHYDWHWQWPYGNGDLGNQGIHQMDLARWGLNVDGLSKSVLSYGGRFGYIDAGETANTQVVIHEYGDQTLVFEVRGLETDALRRANVGVIYEGTEGYVVISSYTGGAAFDKNGEQIRSFSGGADHYENFLKAVRSGDGKDLTADIEEGHISSALCHTGNISYQLGEVLNLPQTRERLAAIRSSDDVNETLARTVQHLEANGVQLRETPFQVGPHLAFDPESETFPGNDQANLMLTREYREPFVVPARGKV